MISRRFCATFIALLSNSVLFSQEAKPIEFASQPFLSSDSQSLVFAWRGDIWSAPSTGGEATPLITHPADESSPQLSSDGKTLYFSSNRSGSNQVHRRSIAGGTVEQLTFNSEGCTLQCVAKDELSLIVRGLRDQVGGRAPYRLIRIRLDKPSPESILFDDYGSEASLSPDGQQLLFTRDGERLYRKGYKGDRASKVWQADLANGTFKELIKRSTESRNPLWLPDASGFYYVGEQQGAANLYHFDLQSSKERQLTNYTDDGVILPQLSADGSTLIYRYQKDIFTLSTQAGSQPTKISIHHQQDLSDISTETLTINKTSDADFTPKGLEIVFSAQGELWTMDTILKEPHRITHSAAYESDVLFSSDSEWIYYVLDDGVDANIRRMKRKNSNEFWWQANDFEDEAVTTGPKTKSSISLSPDGQSLAYVADKGELWVSKLDGSESKRLMTSWDRPSYSWSPDSKWICYSLSNNNFNEDIYITPVDGSSEPVNISRHPDNEHSAAWSPDGKKIAFSGKRHDSEYDIFIISLTPEAGEETKRDQLKKEAIEKMIKKAGYKTQTEKPSSENSEATKDEAEQAEEKDSAKEKKKDDKKDTKDKEKVIVEIDFKDIHKRIQRLKIKESPSRLIWSHDSKKIYYQSSGSLHSVTVKDGKTELVSKNAGHILRLEKNDKIYWISNNAPAVLEKKKNTRYSFSTSLERSRSHYQRQAYRRIWRTMRDQFYDPHLNNRDWPKVLAKYEDSAANAPTSRDFERLATMLLGELNASHMGFYARSKWPKPWAPLAKKNDITAHLGTHFDRSHTTGGLKISHIIPRSPAAQQKSRLEVGEIILSIDGQAIDFTTALPTVLNGPKNRDIILQVRNKQEEVRDVTIRPISYGAARNLARDAQLDQNAQIVSEASDSKYGYIHVARMAWPEFEEFERQIFERGFGKDGLIIDVRDNGGGFTADHLLTVLTPPRFTYTIPRDGGTGYPHGRRVYATWHKPVVVLCNQHSYSNAEIFSHAVKDLGRGKVVGVSTAGGVISTGSANILDIGRVRLPFRGWFLNRNGEDMELYPATPHVVVWPEIGTANTPQDKQLLTAIQVLGQEIQAASSKAAKPALYRSQNPIKE